jgi:hypothetical protein
MPIKSTFLPGSQILSVFHERSRAEDTRFMSGDCEGTNSIPLVTKGRREAVARQSAKIREIGDALCAAGHLTLDQQALALGLSRSTTWSILQAGHKSSGLSTHVINRMLAWPKLPPAVRSKIFEYVAEKREGLYGHSNEQLCKFMFNLSFGPCPAERGGVTRHV